MTKNWIAAAGAALTLMSFVAPATQAASIAGLEAARTRARLGQPLTPRDRQLLHKYGTGSQERRGMQQENMRKGTQQY